MSSQPHHINKPAYILRLALIACMLSSLSVVAPPVAAENFLFVEDPATVQTSMQSLNSYKGEIEIDAAISKESLQSPAEQIEELTNKAYDKCMRYCLPRSRSGLLKKVRDMAQYATTYKGFESSSEADEMKIQWSEGVATEPSAAERRYARASEG